MSEMWNHQAWTTWDRITLDAAYNNSAAVPNAPEIAGRWIARGEAIRTMTSRGLDIPYGPGERNKVDIFPAAAGAADARLRPWRLLADAGEGAFHLHHGWPPAGRHLGRARRLYAGAGREPRHDCRGGPHRHRPDRGRASRLRGRSWEDLAFGMVGRWAPDRRRPRP